eukprot:75245_1
MILPLQWIAIGLMITFAPIIAYCGRILYAYRNIVYFKKRRIGLVSLTYITASLSIYTLCIVCVFDPNPYYTTWYPAVLSIASISQLIIIRFWAQYVDIKKSQALSEWKQHLNPQYHSQQFVIKYYHIIGRTTFHFYTFTAMTFIGFLCYITALLIGRYSPMFLTLFVIYGLLVIFSFASFKFVDHWKIYWEYRYYLFLCLIAVIVCIFMYIIDFSDTIDQTVTFLLLNHHFIMIIIATTMIPYIAFKQNLKRNKPKNRVHKNKPSLLNVIKTNQGYELFMHHLNKEFALENMLYLSIIIQFQSFLYENNLLYGDDNNRAQFTDVNKHNNEEHIYRFAIHSVASQSSDDNKLLKDFVLPTIVPIAPIFQLDNETDKMKQLSIIYLSIYEKYIERHKAELEINISSDLSLALSKHAEYLRNNVDNVEYIQINLKKIWSELSNSALQIYSLLHDSYSRFNYQEWEMCAT